MNTIKHLEKLGFKAKEKVTGLEGVITSVDFDLYGCVQFLVQPSAKDGEIPRSKWFDVTRIDITSKERVMEMPDFDKGYISEGKKGPANKPIK